jgi:phosphoribosylanthranilate isomerase
MKISVLIMMFLLHISVNALAMTKFACNTSKNVTILFGEEEKPVEILQEYAQLFKACTLYLDMDPRIFPLKAISYEVGRIIINQLESLKVVHDIIEQPEMIVALRRKNDRIDQKIQKALDTIRIHLSKIRKSFEMLSGDLLIDVLKALDYLDISILTRIACDVAVWHNARSIDSENISSVIMDLGNSIIQRKIARLPGRVSARRRTLMPYVSRPVVTLSGKMIFGDSWDQLAMKDLQSTARREILLARESLDMFYAPSACIDKNGKVFFVSREGDAYVWDQNGTLNVKWKIDGNSITAFCITDDGRMVTGSDNGIVRVWDSPGRPGVGFRGSAAVGLIKVTSDGKIVCWYKDFTSSICDIESRSTLYCEGHDRRRQHLDSSIELSYWYNKPLSTCISSDNKIISDSWESTIRIWDSAGKELAVCRGHSKQVTAVRMLPSGKIVSGSYDSTIRIWNIGGTQCIALNCHTGPINALDVFSDGTIASASQDGTVRIWSENGTLITTFQEHKSSVASVVLTPNEHVVSVSEDGVMLIWDRKKNAILEKIMHLNKEQAIKVWKLLQRRPTGDTQNIQRYWNDVQNVLDGTYCNHDAEERVSFWTNIAESLENFFT